MRSLENMHLPTFDFLRRRKRNYELCFNAPGSKGVLADLAQFCRAGQTCFHPDPRVHAVLEGRREVFLRISNHLNLSPSQLYDLLATPNSAGE